MRALRVGNCSAFWSISSIGSSIRVRGVLNSWLRFEKKTVLARSSSANSQAYQAVTSDDTWYKFVHGHGEALYKLLILKAQPEALCHKKYRGFCLLARRGRIIAESYGRVLDAITATLRLDGESFRYMLNPKLVGSR